VVEDGGDVSDLAARPTLLVSVEKARDLLAKARTFDDVKRVRDVAVAMRAYARTQKAGREIALDAAEIVFRADARMGELARGLAKVPAGREKNRSGPRTNSKLATLADLGVTKQRASEQQRVASMGEDVWEKYLRACRGEGRAPVTSEAAKIAAMPPRAMTSVITRMAKGEATRSVLAEACRAIRVGKLAEIAKGEVPLTGSMGRFPVILADPPWRYEHVKTESRAIENQYPSMDLDDIRRMPVADIATTDSILFLWATSPKLTESLSVVDAWGFTYRTCAVWTKDMIGMGYYFRQQHELLLVCTRGNPPTPAPSDRVSSVVSASRGKHSAKPVEFYEIIERMYPTLPKVELFCRSPRSGWQAWGNQASKEAAE